MPWKHLAEWAAAQNGTAVETPVPLTMVTLRRAPDCDGAAISFHYDAEFKALMQWAEAGQFVLAFAALDIDELTLFCAEEPAQVAPQVARLPFVAAGLATAAIRPVAKLRLTSPLRPTPTAFDVP